MRSGGPAPPTRVVSDPRTNQLIIVGPERTQRRMQLAVNERTKQGNAIGVDRQRILGVVVPQIRFGFNQGIVRGVARPQMSG